MLTVNGRAGGAALHSVLMPLRASLRLQAGIFPLLLFFAVQAGFWGGIGAPETTRRELLVAAVAQIVVIGLGFIWLAVTPPQRRGRWTLDRRDLPVFALLGVWLAAVTAAAGVGLLARHPPQLVLGDYYKFAVLPAIMLLAYLGIETAAQPAVALRWIVVLFGGILVYDFVRFYPLLAAGHRFVSNAVAMIAALSPLICYLLHVPPSRIFVVAGAAVFAETMVVLSIGQVLGGFAAYLLSLGLLLGLRRARLTIALIAVVLMTLAFNVTGNVSAAPPGPAVPAGAPGQTPGPPPKSPLLRTDRYIGGKLYEAIEGRSLTLALDILGGSRLGEIVAIFREMGRHPAKIALGFGLGGALEPVRIGPATGSQAWSWERPRHYIHAGLFEVLYRTGAVGLAAVLAMLVAIGRRGVRVAAQQGDPFGVFVLANMIVQGCLLAFNSALMSPDALLALSFAGVAAIERGPRSPSALRSGAGQE